MKNLYYLREDIMFFGKMGWKRGYGERWHKSVAPFMKASGRGARNMGMGR